MPKFFYTFDGDKYDATPEDEQALLEAVADAISSEVWTSAEYSTDEERQEAESMSYDGTNVMHMTFWQNMMAIMQMAPCELDIQRHDFDLQESCIRYVDEYVYYGYGLRPEERETLRNAIATAIRLRIEDALPTASLERIQEVLSNGTTSGWEALDAAINKALEPFDL